MSEQTGRPANVDHDLFDGPRTIPFVQFLRPDGRRRDVNIERPNPVMDKADAIQAAGLEFQCEEFSSGMVSLTISDDERDWATELCMNGPAVPDAVDRLVMNFDLSKVSVPHD